MVGVLNGSLLQESIDFAEIMTTEEKENINLFQFKVCCYMNSAIQMLLVCDRLLDHVIYSGDRGVDQS